MHYRNVESTVGAKEIFTLYKSREHNTKVMFKVIYCKN